MSWIFGFYSKNICDSNSVSRLHPPSLTTINTNNFYAAIGGNQSTFHFHHSDQKINYFLCGVPISEEFERVLEKPELDKLFLTSPEKIENLNGHYCGIHYKNNSLNFFTDKLGLREFHIYENDLGWYFSTRLDWLLKLNHFEIDYSEFGSRWLLINQLSNKSIVKNIIRLNCGTKACISNNRLELIENNWTPARNSKIGIDDFNDSLQKIVLLGSNSNSKISLSLSGGLDSRVILSYLLNSHYSNWDCHTFHSDDQMDSTIAERISKDHDFNLHLLVDQTNNSNSILSQVQEYLGNTYLTESGYISRKLTHYNSLHKEELIIDGGFGEIWRRAFLNKLYIFGKKDLLNKNFETIPQYITYHRANIFNEEHNSKMNSGIINQIENLYDALPHINEVGFGNWLDLFSLKTRLVNYYGSEQARIDGYVKAYMPFVQLGLIENLLSLPVNERKHNRLFKKIIKRNYNSLSKYPLAKGNQLYPYYLNPLMKKGYSLLQSKLSKPTIDKNYDDYLYSMKEFTLDSISSQSVKEYSPYNYNLIKDTIHSYYDGELNKRKFVDWFITFEIFRQVLD